MSSLLYFTYNFAVSYKTNCTHSIFRTIKARTSLAQRIVKWQQHRTFSYREFTFGRYCSVRSMCHYVLSRVIMGFKQKLSKNLIFSNFQNHPSGQPLLNFAKRQTCNASCRVFEWKLMNSLYAVIELCFKIKEVLICPSRKRFWNHSRLHFTSKTP